MATKHVVSISLGSSSRDTRVEAVILGETVLIERRGVDGDFARAAALFAELDGEVDAFGLGGTDLFVMAGGRRYYIRESRQLVRNAKKTPVVCGAGLKDTLERRAIEKLDAAIGWRGRKVVLVSAVDRFGMAEALEQAGAETLYGDLIFLLGLPIPLRSLRAVDLVARLTAPVLSQLPIRWLYPTGSRQDEVRADWRTRYFTDAEVIAGDFHLIRRFLPPRLPAKIVLTNTTTPSDIELLRERGAAKLITTTPRFEGRSLATNLLEAAFVAISGKHPLTPADYRELLERSGLEPDVVDFGGPD